jgi:hypothetical protein
MELVGKRGETERAAYILPCYDDNERKLYSIVPLQTWDVSKSLGDDESGVRMNSLFAGFFSSCPPRVAPPPSSAPPLAPNAPGLDTPGEIILDRCCLGEAG